MSSLLKQIKQIEKELEHNNETINQQYDLVKERITTPKMMSLAIVSSFAIGFLFARNKSKTELIFAASAAALTARRLYKNIEFMLALTKKS